MKKIEERTDNVLKMITETSTKENYEMIFNVLSTEIVKLATEEGESLQVLFHCEDMKQFKDFKARIVDAIKVAIENAFSKLNSSVSEAIAISLFNGLAYIVKDANNDIDKLRDNLKMYSDTMIKNIETE